MSTLILLWYTALVFLPAIIAYVRHAPVAVPLILVFFTFIAVALIGPFAILVYCAAWVAAFTVKRNVPAV